jgi:twitching motility protein PilT
MRYQIDDLLTNVVSAGVSDVHLKPGHPPLVRLNGDLIETDKYPPLSPEDTLALAYQLFRGHQKEEFESGFPVDTSHQITGLARFRVNVFRQRRQTVIILRIIPMRIPTFEELHLPQVLRKIAMEPRGLVLVTGVTGSGKSTTLACMLNYLNGLKSAHILTIEDPIEFLYTDNVASISQVEIGYDSSGFDEALRSSLRQDPDIILVGEMRDMDTVKTAIKAAEMGYLIFSTLHTTDCPKTINRILDVFPAHQQMQVRQQLATSLKAVISMRLLPKASGGGRIPAMEIMIQTSTIAGFIEDAKKTGNIKDMIEAGRSQYGMQTFDQHLTELYRSGEITLETAVQASSSPADFQRALQFE